MYQLSPLLIYDFLCRTFLYAQFWTSIDWIRQSQCLAFILLFKNRFDANTLKNQYEPLSLHFIDLIFALLFIEEPSCFQTFSSDSVQFLP